MLHGDSSADENSERRYCSLHVLSCCSLGLPICQQGKSVLHGDSSAGENSAFWVKGCCWVYGTALLTSMLHGDSSADEDSEQLRG